MKNLLLPLIVLMVSACSSPQTAHIPPGDDVPTTDRVAPDLAAPDLAAPEPEEERIATVPPMGLEAEPQVSEAAVPASNLTAEVRQAVEGALPFLEQEGTAWMEGRVSIQGGSPCVSCHHVGYALWTHHEAKRVGIDVLTPAFEELAATAVDFLDRKKIPRAMSAAQVMLARPGDAARLEPWMLELQNATGDWSARGQFPTQDRPIVESDAIATMYALLALQQVAGDQAHSEDQTEAHAKAMTWLDEQADGQSTEWLAWRLVLATHQATSEQTADLSRSLLDRQRTDGGWGWLAEADSDAFSTGQALYALAETAGKESASTEVDQAIERARRFLIDGQTGDGSWQTASQVVSAEPSEDKDVIYHFWGTAWATLGLARSLDAHEVTDARVAEMPRSTTPQFVATTASLGGR